MQFKPIGLKDVHKNAASSKNAVASGSLGDHQTHHIRMPVAKVAPKTTLYGDDCRVSWRPFLNLTPGKERFLSYEGLEVCM